jgi:hypothetical protein
MRGVLDDACPRTKAVEAACVVLVSTAAVGTMGVPVNVGDASDAGVKPRAPVISAETRDRFMVGLPATPLALDTERLEVPLVAMDRTVKTSLDV